MESTYIISIKSKQYSDSYIISDNKEETVKNAINKIHSENYTEEYCKKWEYVDGSGSYFDQIIWDDVYIDVHEIKIIS